METKLVTIAVLLFAAPAILPTASATTATCIAAPSCSATFVFEGAGHFWAGITADSSFTGRIRVDVWTQTGHFFQVEDCIRGTCSILGIYLEGTGTMSGHFEAGQTATCAASQDPAGIGTARVECKSW